MLDIAAALVTLTAFLAWLNHKFVRLPSAIGVMGIALLLSLGLVGLGRLGFAGLTEQAERLVASVDFTTLSPTCSAAGTPSGSWPRWAC
jgi:CPA1 family monovalent cation:H+ antiporter